MPGLEMLLGLAGGLGAAGNGLNQMSQQYAKQEEENKRTALQLLLAGYRPGTPTAQGHPNAQGMMAHLPPGVVDPLNDLRTAPQPSRAGDGYHVSQDVQSSTPGSALNSLVSQPDQIDVDGVHYTESPIHQQSRDLSAQLGQANLRHLLAETDAIEHPVRSPITLSHVAGQGGAPVTRLLDPVTHQPVGSDIPEAAPPKADKPTYGNFRRPDGQTVTVPKDEGVRQGWVEVPLQGPGGLSGTAQNMQARLVAAMSEGSLANERMTAFENAHLKNGQLDVSPMADMGAALNAGLAGAHNPISIMIGRGAGSALNATGNGDVVQYQRDAHLIARAEQLMSARGGSESMASENAYLSGAPAGAPEATVRAAQKSRTALFGKLGAVIQTLTPDQIAKLNQGLAALHQESPDFANKSPLEQTLDAIDRAGLGADIQAAASAPTAGRQRPSIESLLGQP